MGLFSTIALQSQLSELDAELATAVPGSPQAILLEQQIAVLQNEIAETPIVPPIFGGGMGFGGGGFGRGGGHRG